MSNFNHHPNTILDWKLPYWKHRNKWFDSFQQCLNDHHGDYQYTLDREYSQYLEGMWEKISKVFWHPWYGWEKCIIETGAILRVDEAQLINKLNKRLIIIKSNNNNKITNIVANKPNIHHIDGSNNINNIYFKRLTISTWVCTINSNNLTIFSYCSFYSSFQFYL